MPQTSNLTAKPFRNRKQSHDAFLTRLSGSLAERFRLLLLNDEFVPTPNARQPLFFRLLRVAKVSSDDSNQVWDDHLGLNNGPSRVITFAANATGVGLPEDFAKCDRRAVSRVVLFNESVAERIRAPPALLAAEGFLAVRRRGDPGGAGARTDRARMAVGITDGARAPLLTRCQAIVPTSGQRIAA